MLPSMQEMIDQQTEERKKAKLGQDSVVCVGSKRFGSEFQAIFQFTNDSQSFYTKDECEKLAETGGAMGAAAQWALFTWLGKPEF